LMWAVAPYSFTYRHIVPLFFFGGVVIGGLLAAYSSFLLCVYFFVLCLYFLLSIVSSFQQALRYKTFSFVFLLPLAFFVFHFVYGLGIAYGLFLIVLRKFNLIKKFQP